MGRDQRIIDELRAFERLCVELAEESRVPEEAGALRELAGNYGREAARLTVIKTVDCSRAHAKKTCNVKKVDRTPLVPNRPRRPPLCRQRQGCYRGNFIGTDKLWSQTLSVII